MLGVMLMVLMGCGTKSSFVKTNYAMEVKHVEAAGKQLMVMMPGLDAQVQFVSHKQRDFAGAPSIAHSGILLNVAAAFTLDTESMDVCGDHVVAGERIRGYDDVTATGHMLIINNKVSIKGNSCLEQSIQEAVAARGYLFQQCYIVEDGRAVVERIPQAILDRQPHILFRAACVMKDGEFAVVQGGETRVDNTRRGGDVSCRVCPLTRGAGRAAGAVSRHGHLGMGVDKRKRQAPTRAHREIPKHPLPEQLAASYALSGAFGAGKVERGTWNVERGWGIEDEGSRMRCRVVERSSSRFPILDSPSSIPSPLVNCHLSGSEAVFLEAGVLHCAGGPLAL